MREFLRVWTEKAHSVYYVTNVSSFHALVNAGFIFVQHLRGF